MKKHLHLPSNKECGMEQEMVAEKVPLMTSKLQFPPDILESALVLPQKVPPFFDHIVFVLSNVVQSILSLEKLYV